MVRVWMAVGIVVWVGSPWEHLGKAIKRFWKVVRQTDRRVQTRTAREWTMVNDVTVDMATVRLIENSLTEASGELYVCL